MNSQTKNDVNDNINDFQTILAISVGATELWFNPDRQLSTTQPLVHTPAVGWGRESE